jgi:hypothetical protein
METRHIALAGATLAIAASVAYVAINFNQSNRDFSTQTVFPSECKWLDEESFRVFSAIVDTLIPKYEIPDVTLKNVKGAIEVVAKGLLEVSNVSEELIESKRKSLCRGAIEANIDVLACLALERQISVEQKSELRSLLSAMATSAGNGMVTGYFTPFHRLPLSEREHALRCMRDALISQLRTAFQAMKRLTATLFFSHNDKHGNPLWDQIGYYPEKTLHKGTYRQFPQLPAKSPANNSDAGGCCGDVEFHPRVRLPLAVQQKFLASTTAKSGFDSAVPDDAMYLEADVVVVGSGAGGGMLAAELVKAGLSVVVLEKGGYFTPQSDFSRWREIDAFANTFEQGGLCGTKDGNIAVLAGACVGGGTTINWCASFRTPDFILEEWDTAFGGNTCFR